MCIEDAMNTTAANNCAARNANNCIWGQVRLVNDRSFTTKDAVGNIGSGSSSLSTLLRIKLVAVFI